MRRTHATSLIVFGLVGVVIGYLVDTAAAASGLPVLVPPLSLPFTLVAIGAIVVLLAVPIRRAVKGTSKTRIDPFRAMRVAVLAKASSLSGVLLAGGGIGILLYLLSRSIVPALGSIWLAIATVLGAVVLLVAGLVAEHFCTLPPGDDTEEAKGARV
ncbi:DUF3180 domain-containing protein [Luethyella okanaganae]|uniref:DUF3180 domain-containing protein n=1 Tax=Luethyella okanaganae TaxID=69372 RepID=A0ABW1VG45_9MICO